MACVGVFDLIWEHLTNPRKPMHSRTESQDEVATSTESVPSTDEESNEESVARDCDALLPTYEKGEKTANKSTSDGVEMSFVSDAHSVQASDELSVQQDKTEEVMRLEQQKNKDTAITKTKLSMLAGKLSRKASGFKINKNVPQVDELDDDEDSVVAADEDESFMSPRLTESRLKALLAEQQEEVEKEVEELIRTILVGFEEEEVEKELNDQRSVGKSFTPDVQNGAECIMAALVDRMDIVCGPCSRCRPTEIDDDSSLALDSAHSVCSGKERESVCDTETEYNPYVEMEAALSGDVDSVGEDTFNTYGDESLVSEYDDFNKAMKMLKNRAARHRLSEARLLESVRSEQQRRKSQGLTPTMIEI